MRGLDAQALLDAVPGVVAVVDEFGVVTWISPSVTGVAGYEPEELVGTEVVSHLDLSWNPMALESILFALTNPGVQLPTMLAFKPKDGGDPIIMEATANNQLENPSVRALVAHLRVCGEEQMVDEILESAASGHRLEATMQRVFAVAAATTMQADTVVVLCDEPGLFLGSDPDLEWLVQPGVPGTPWDLAAQTLEPVLVGDVGALPSELRLEAEARGYQACWAYPVPRVDAAVAAAVLVYWRRSPGEPEPNAAMLADRLTRQVALVLRLRTVH